MKSYLSALQNLTMGPMKKKKLISYVPSLPFDIVNRLFSISYIVGNGGFFPLLTFYISFMILY